MPKYQVELQDGRKLVVEADTQPTEAEVMAHLGGDQPAASQPGQAEPDAQPKSVGGFLTKTAPTSLLKFGADAVVGLANFVNPNKEKNTAYGLTKLAMGGVQKLIPGRQADEAVAENVWEHYKDRYGGVQNIKDTLYNDPFGVLGDASIFAGGTGLAAKAGGLSKVANVAARTSSLVDPMVAMAKVARKTQPTLARMSNHIIRSNVKPAAAMTTKNPTKDIPKLINDADYKPGARGAEQANAVVEQWADELTKRIDNSTNAGQKFDLQPIVDKLDELEEAYTHSPNGGDDLAAVRKARKWLMEESRYGEDILSPQTTQVATGVLDQFGQPVMRPKTTMVKTGRRLKPQDAREIDLMKKNVYQALPGKYGKEMNGTIEVDKTLGRGLKQILDDNIAGAREINSKQADAIVSRNALAAMGRRTGNRLGTGLIDLAAMAGGAGAHMALGPVAALPAIVTSLLNHPISAFPIAHKLNKSAKFTAGPITRGIGRGATPSAVANRVNTAGRLRPMPPRAQAEAEHKDYLRLLNE